MPNCLSAIKKFGLTSSLTVLFLVLLKPNVPATLSFLQFPCIGSETAWGTALIAISLFCCFVYMRTIGLDLFCGLLLALALIVLCASFYNGSDLRAWCTTFLPCIAITLISSALSEKHLKQLLWSCFTASVFYLICNLVSLFQIYNTGQYTGIGYLFFGYKNSTFMIGLPALFCSIMLDAIDGCRFSLRSLTVYCLATFEVLACYSATSLFALVVFGVLFLLIQLKRTRWLINGLTVTGAYFLLFVGTVVLRLQSFFSFLIEDIFGKTVTFTGRTYIWDEAISAIFSGKHALTGYGSTYQLDVVFPSGDIGYYYAHNDFLHFFIMGGVAALACQIAIIAILAYTLYSNRHTTCALFSSCILAALMCIALFESVLCAGTCFILTIAYYCNGTSQSRVPQSHFRTCITPCSKNSSRD